MDMEGVVLREGEVITVYLEDDMGMYFYYRLIA